MNTALKIEPTDTNIAKFQKFVKLQDSDAFMRAACTREMPGIVLVDGKQIIAVAYFPGEGWRWTLASTEACDHMRWVYSTETFEFDDEAACAAMLRLMELRPHWPEEPADADS